MLADLVLWLGAVVIHELGHVLGYQIFGRVPKFRISGITLEVGHNVIYTMPLYQVIIIVLMGILPGIMVVDYFNGSIYVWLAYAIGCSQDITILNSLYQEKNLKMSYLEKIEKDLKGVYNDLGI